jgi:molybdopterin-containing oxidoreductase family iron-sulfur binding subunit
MTSPFSPTSDDQAHPSNDPAQVSDPAAAPLYWRSLSELRGEEEFKSKYLDREFPVAASEFPEGVSRRRWLQLMSASLALAGVSGCRYPEESILPFVVRPEGRVPGEFYYRATNFELANRVYNLLIKCIDGRPLKIEPNTDHPSGGGTDVFAQASILGLYDQDRVRRDDGFLIRKGETRRVSANWEDFDKYAQALITNEAANGGGASFAVLMQPTSSPTTVRMLKLLRERLPKASICQYDAAAGNAMRLATQTVFGKPACQTLDLEQADVIVVLQADILGTDRVMLPATSSFAKRRDPLAGPMNRLYVVEGGFTTTGAAADARLALQPGQMPAFLAELARRVEKLQGGETHDHSAPEEPFDSVDAEQRLERFLDVLAHDIAEAGEKAVVVVGDALGADAIAAGIRMNNKLGSLGKSQLFSAAVDAELSDGISLAELADRIDRGDIDSLLILDTNIVATAPGDIDIASELAKVEQTIYLGIYDDETAALCNWSLPLAHPLESWGDCVDARGNYGVCQPQILPLLGGRSVAEVLAVMLGESEIDPDKIVRRTADAVAGASLSERQWRQLLHDGYAADVVVDSSDLSVSGEAVELTADSPQVLSAVNKDAMEVIFAPADGVYDGRFANNGWLQELPQSITKLTWDNAAVMSPKTAAALELRHGQKVALRIGDYKVILPVYEIPGCAPGVVSTTIGYGRTRAGMVGGYVDEDIDVVGFDVSPIRRGDALLVAYDVEARPNYDEYELATTQDHWAIDEMGMRETQSRSFSLVREGTPALLDKVPEFAAAKGPHVPHVGDHGSLWHEPLQTIQRENSRQEGNGVPQWGMAIDLSKCTGCNACVIACQSENNVPIVGREQVLNSREMHWLRIDRYFQGDEEHATVVQEPVACMHCETAPCEQVCPVAATVHTEEGLNIMAYNRCIGTRYCANNCPFKVRRFNYFNYNEDIGVGYGVKAYDSTIESANRKLQSLVMNPDVTVRGRGVMEKCTYCVQRIEQSRIAARREDRQIRDGDVVTACQSACPANAIEFGNVADPHSKVSLKHADVRSYGMLGQLNLKPRTEYLARIRNTPPRLMSARQLLDLATLEAPHHSGHNHDHEEGTHNEHHDDAHQQDHAHP